MKNHSLQNTEEEPITCGTTPAATAAHRRYLSSPAAATLHRKTQNSRSGFLPNTSAMQHSCSHHNAFCSMTWLTRMYLRAWQHQMTTIIMAAITAICNQRFNKRIELRTNEQRLAAENRGGTDWPRNDPNRNRRTQEVRYIAGCSRFTRKNTRFRAPASSPKQTPCNILAAITLRYFAVSHHPSLSVLLCGVKSHTTLHWVYCYILSNLTPPFIEFIAVWCKTSHHPLLSALLCDVKFHTTFHWVYCYVMQSLLSTLHQVKVIRNSENCFPTSFDKWIYMDIEIDCSMDIMWYNPLNNHGFAQWFPGVL